LVAQSLKCCAARLERYPHVKVVGSAAIMS
jgi:hypothetical protein